MILVVYNCTINRQKLSNKYQRLQFRCANNQTGRTRRMCKHEISFSRLNWRLSPQGVWTAPRGPMWGQTCQKEKVMFFDLWSGLRPFVEQPGKEWKARRSPNLLQAPHCLSESSFSCSLKRKVFPLPMNKPPFVWAGDREGMWHLPVPCGPQTSLSIPNWGGATAAYAIQKW